MTFQTPKTVKSKVIAPAFVSGSHTNISFAYDANSQVINATSSGSGSGGSRPTITTINSFTTNAYTISSPASSSVLEEIYLISNGSTAVTINLPTAAGIAGMKYQIKRLGTANVTIDGNSTETIDGATTLILYNQNTSATIVSDNSNWVII